MECNTLLRGKFKVSFYKLGTVVGRYPGWTITISTISTLVFALGFLRIRHLTDFDYLMTPIGCRAYDEERTLQELFPINTSTNFDLYRALHRGRVGTIIVIPKDRGNVLRKSVFSEITRLDNIIQGIAIKKGNKSLNYSVLCARRYRSCWTNDILELNKKIPQIESGIVRVQYPLEIRLFNDYVNLALFLGGVKTDDESNIVQSKALRLFYFLDSSDSEKLERAVKWEEEFLRVMADYKADLIDIDRFTSLSIDVEVWKFSSYALKFGWISFTITVLFSIVTSMTKNWVKSKLWLGLCGCISVGMAIITSFGLMITLGVGYVALNVGVPFLIIGIGVDDTFVLIAAWRSTNPEESVEKRMGKTFSKAATSITMTSLTNFISFLVGMLSPLPSLRIFCLYCAAAVFFDFVYQVTFFGACMALDGYREHSRIHPITFHPVNTTEETINKGRLYKMLFTDKAKMHINQPPALMIWCRDVLGTLMGKIEVRVAILTVLILYLGGAAWNLATLHEGIEYKDVFPYDSYASSFANNYYRYFTHYPHQIQVVINITMDYSDPKVQSMVLSTLERFHEAPFIEDIEINWLKYYLDYINHKDAWIHRATHNFSNPEDFIGFLRDVFLRLPAARDFQQDIVFDNNTLNITASRFVIFSKDISESSEEKQMVIKLREIADSSPLPVTVQNIWWKNYEQLLILKDVAIQSIAVASMTTVIVFSLFLPHFSSVLCAALVIASIQFGAIGYMASLGITLNGISTVILIMSTGFCVDYSAHVSYSYMEAEGSYRERIKQALFAAAMPIMQASCSTVFGVVTLSIVPSLILYTFSTIVFLIVLIASIHAIFFLPALLSIWNIMFHKQETTMNNEQMPPDQVPTNN